MHWRRDQGPHAEALLADDESTFAVEVDLRDPAGILSNPDVREHLDREQPAGLLMCGVLHYVLDEEHPGDVVAALLRECPVDGSPKPPTGLPAYPQWPRATWTILTMTKIIAMAR